MAPLALFLLLASTFTSVLASSQHQGMNHRQDDSFIISAREQASLGFASTFQASDAATQIINVGEDPVTTAIPSTSTLSLAFSSTIESVVESNTVQPPSATTTIIDSSPVAPSTTVAESLSTDASLPSVSSTAVSAISSAAASVTLGPAPAVLSNLKRSTTASVSASKTSSVALLSRAASASASATVAQTGAAQKRGEFVGFVAVAVVAGFVGSLMV